MSKVVDQAQRDEALDQTRSFIVQAPAGSGKTGLITQRYLVLLAGVQRPEEIVAITFTRKAAGEMRARILEALHSARHDAPSDPHALKTWQLARAVLQRDAAQGWQLLNQPSRLVIQTIDSLCASLTRQLPMMSRFGAQPGISDVARELYQQAAQQTLADLEKGEQWSSAIEALLRHLDNDLAHAESMLVEMLARRDQWLRHLLTVNSAPQRRELLEGALVNLVDDAMARLAGRIPAALSGELMDLLHFACNEPEPYPDEAGLAELSGLPSLDSSALTQWQALIEFLLTTSDDWRKQVNAKLGFPAPSATKDKELKATFKEMKDRYQALIGELQQDEGLLEILVDIRNLPQPRFADSQWQLVEALCELLLIAAGRLWLVFAERGQVDFSEISRSAIQALGSEDEPTDLGLAMDYRIQHLLVDEFQDTSYGQYELLQRLTAGWQPGDGRTLFVVGDPMQSIYRFREAEVGLYLQAWEQGIGEVKLVPLKLQVNFRSAAGVVDWVNESFSQVLPAQRDVSIGAVDYSASVPFHAAEVGEAVHVHPQLENDRQAEAQQVVTLVRQAYAERPEGSVAILVRSRPHLVDIIPALKNAGLSYRAIEIEQLAHRPVVQDLYALTRALLHPADRAAWLAVLRAPWCGLSLADMELLAGEQFERSLWAVLADPLRRVALSDDGQRRLQRLVEVLEPAISLRQQRALRPWLESVWLALGGPACVTNPTDLEDAEVYLRLLEQIELGGDLESLAVLAEKLAALYALPDVTGDVRLQLMTIHKSKGLEFDTVILPGLARPPAKSDHRLLIWMERAGHGPEGELLLAPVNPVGAERDAVYDYLCRLDKRKGELELGRLLYVAATRAKKQLHLLGHVLVNEEKGELKTPINGSLLNLLWPQLQERYEAAYREAGQQGQGELVNGTSAGEFKLQRLTCDWQLPPLAALEQQTYANPEEHQVEFVWATDVARHVGTVVHALLQRIAEQGLDLWDEARLQALAPYIERQLIQQGVVRYELEDAVVRTVATLQAMLNDEHGRWLLDNRHEASRTEYALTSRWRSEGQRIVIDRTFVDENGVRWIIDYKTGVHEGGDLEVFLDSELERYRPQLENYAAVMAKREQRSIMLGLYFPLYHGWRSWTYTGK